MRRGRFSKLRRQLKETGSRCLFDQSIMLYCVQDTENPENAALGAIAHQRFSQAEVDSFRESFVSWFHQQEKHP